ncbi:MAG: DNA repair protein RecO [Planctomycetota bacterium]|nr:DNA repair protein RecO [Planctomycetota bacterium]MDA1213341.1 DNA repair protein RecO [Planctomycetota bacterium]
MSAEKCDALIIRLTDFSETSKVVTCFTREWGKVSALAKGARRLRSAFEAALDLLSVCKIVFLRKSSGGLDLLTEAQLTTRFQPNGQDLGSFYAGCYVAELLSSLTIEHDPHQELFEAAVTTIRRLEQSRDYKIAVTHFELILLKEIGQLPVFECCIHCQKPIEHEQLWAYWIGQSGFLCSACRHEEHARVLIHATTIQLLHELSHGIDVLPDDLTLTPQQVKESRHILTSTITHIIGRRPKVLSYLSSL